VKAIFLDRDGTLLIDSGYMYMVEQIQYFPDTFSALKMMQRCGYELFIVTNQSGIGRGLFSTEDMNLFHQKMLDDFNSQGPISIREIAFCPDHPDHASPYRKPGPQMILDLIKKYSISASHSFMVGNTDADCLAGKNAKVPSIAVREHVAGFPFYSTLLEFAQTLKKD